MQKIGFGGSCHWCTEAVFQSFRGVVKVDQGWIASTGDHAAFSEAVVVTFDPTVISLETLIAIHLNSHSCTSVHQLREKYRSSVYSFNAPQAAAAKRAIAVLQTEFNEPIITEILPLSEFKLNDEQYLNYYYSDPRRPFCENIVGPKLEALRKRFGKQMISDDQSDDEE